MYKQPFSYVFGIPNKDHKLSVWDFEQVYILHVRWYFL